MLRYIFYMLNSIENKIYHANECLTGLTFLMLNLNMKFTLQNMLNTNSFFFYSDYNVLPSTPF